MRFSKKLSSIIVVALFVLTQFTIGIFNIPTVCAEDTAQDILSPTAPTNLRLVSITSNSATLVSDLSTDNMGVVEYEVYQDSNLVQSDTGTSHIISGLLPNTTYNFTVKAKDAAGNVSDSSNILTLSTLPSEVISGIRFENSSDYTGFKTIITRNELPLEMQNFTKIRVITSDRPFNTAITGLPSWSLEYGSIYNDPSYNSSVPSIGTWNLLVILSDNYNNPVGYLETTVNVTGPIPNLRLPKIESGIRFENSADYMGFKTFVNRNELPLEMQNFTKISVATSNEPFNADQNGIPSWAINGYKDIYRDYGFGSGVQSVGTWNALVILFDNNNNPVGYLETMVDVTGPIPNLRLPKIESGIRFENSADYIGFKTFITRNELPLEMQNFTKISVITSNGPFNADQNGIPSWALNTYKGTYEDYGFGSGVQSVGTWNALVILFDNNNNPVGYLETMVDVTGPIPNLRLPKIESGIRFENSADYIGFKTFITRNELPLEMQNFTKISVITSNGPFNADQNGIPSWALNTYKGTYEDYGFGSGVQSVGTWNALVILFDNENNPLGYLETTVNVTGPVSGI